MWDLIVSVPDHCLSFYFSGNLRLKTVSHKALNSFIDAVTFTGVFTGPIH